MAGARRLAGLRCRAGACLGFLARAGAAFVELNSSHAEDGLSSVFVKYMEPFGVVCMGYVDEGSPNLEVLRKLGKLEESRQDPALADLQVPLVAAVGWREPGSESLTLIYRKPFERIWPQLNMSVMDENDKVFPAKRGSTWKASAIVKWFMANAYPTINVRVLERKEDIFPEDRYLSPFANTGGAALIFANLTGDKEISTQLSISMLLRKHAERLKGKVRFSFVDRTKNTRTLRERFSAGVDAGVEAELLLLERAGYLPTDQHELNHWHGDPKKYRLRELTQESVDAFFEGFERGTLPTYWVSSESYARKGPPPAGEKALRLTAGDFERVVLDEDPKRCHVVAFFNDAEKDGCRRCADGRGVWEDLAKTILSSKSWRGRVLIASLDQSTNEHPENLVASKLAQPMIVWYPAGSRAKRLKQRRVMTTASKYFTKDRILKDLEDIMDTAQEDDEL